MTEVEWPADDDMSWRAVAKRWECLYREAVGIPAPEHMARRLEAMADAVERSEAQLAAARSALAACREVAATRRAPTVVPRVPDYPERDGNESRRAGS